MATLVRERVTSPQEEVVVRGAREETRAPHIPMTAEDVRVMIEQQLRSAYEKAMAQLQAEIAEPEGPFQWDVLAFGPIQPGAGLWPFTPAPFLPNQIIRTGETAFAVSFLVFGPISGVVLPTFALPYEITYSTGELKRWVLGPPNLQQVNNGNLTPGLPFAVDVFPFVANDEGLYEMNVCARILDAGGGNAPPFSGFARRIQKIEPILFLPQPLVMFDTGMRFQVYD